MDGIDNFKLHTRQNGVVWVCHVACIVADAMHADKIAFSTLNDEKYKPNRQQYN